MPRKLLKLGSFDVVVKTNSWMAYIAAKCLRAENVAFTLGNTIHLHNASIETFLKDEAWIKHELKHVEQFKRYGFFRFIFKYIIETAKHGYHNNKYEVEARAAEKQPKALTLQKNDRS